MWRAFRRARAEVGVLVGPAVRAAAVAVLLGAAVVLRAGLGEGGVQLLLDDLVDVGSGRWWWRRVVLRGIGDASAFEGVRDDLDERVLWPRRGAQRWRRGRQASEQPIGSAEAWMIVYSTLEHDAPVHKPLQVR